MTAEGNEGPSSFLAQFGSLNPAEQQLVEATERGEACDFRVGDAAADDPKLGDQWGDERTVRAAVIYRLCVDSADAPIVHPKGVRLVGAKVDGPLDFEAATLRVPLRLEGCYVPQPITLRDAQTRTIALHGSRIHGLSADRVQVAGSVVLDAGFHATGEVRLLGATIGGQLDCRGGTFENQGSNALSADGVQVAGNVFFDEEFHAKGEVRLLGATIKGQLNCSGGTFENEGGDALSLDRAQITGDVYLDEGFHATGAVRLLGATIEGQLGCQRGRLDGDLILRDARVAVLLDDAMSWPAAPHRLMLDGLVYERLHADAPLDVADRLRWLKRQWPQTAEVRFLPQPFDQLAAAYTRMGYEERAREVRIAKQRARRRRSGTRWFKRFPEWLLLDLGIRYGWRPLRPLWLIPVFLAAGWVMAWGAGAANVFQPVSAGSLGAASQPLVHWLFYSLDTLVPILDLNVERHWWIPESSHRWGPVGSAWFQGYFVFHTVIGWIVATLAVAGLTGLVRRT